MKSASIIAKSLALDKQGKTVILLKPSLDTRNESVIASRATETVLPAFLINEDNMAETRQHILNKAEGETFVFVDECQMLSRETMSELIHFMRNMGVGDNNIVALFYGLKNNFKNELFDSIPILLSEADIIEELKSTCQFCSHSAQTHMLEANGEFVTEGSELAVETDDTSYYSVCQTCRWNKLGFKE